MKYSGDILVEENKLSLNKKSSYKDIQRYRIDLLGKGFTNNPIHIRYTLIFYCIPAVHASGEFVRQSVVLLLGLISL